MMKSGFLFVLTNRYANGFVIIGYSYKDPAKLAYVISRATGVPVDFDVSLIKKTDSPFYDYKKIMSSVSEKVIKEKGSVSMVECDSEKFLNRMRSCFGFVSVNKRKASLAKLALLLIALSVFFVVIWYYNFFGIK